jgi:hypothetical protein
MMKRSADTAGGSIGQQAGSALDSVVQPMQSVVNSMRETVASAVSGMAGFMKEPSETMSRRAESAMRTVAEVVRPRPSRTRATGGSSRSAPGGRTEGQRAVGGVARKMRAATKATARAAVKATKPALRKTTSRKPAAAQARARG